MKCYDRTIMISLEKETEVILTVAEQRKQKAIFNLLTLVSIASTMTIAVSLASLIRRFLGY